MTVQFLAFSIELCAYTDSFLAAQIYIVMDCLASDFISKWTWGFGCMVPVSKVKCVEHLEPVSMVG